MRQFFTLAGALLRNTWCSAAQRPDSCIVERKNRKETESGRHGEEAMWLHSHSAARQSTLTLHAFSSVLYVTMVGLHLWSCTRAVASPWLAANDARLCAQRAAADCETRGEGERGGRARDAAEATDAGVHWAVRWSPRERRAGDAARPPGCRGRQLTPPPARAGTQACESSTC